MAHDYLKKSIEKQTGRASAALVMTLMGGVLVVNSFIAQRIFAEPTDQPNSLNPYAAFLALAGAVLLGTPMIKHALVHLWRGASHMDELVALALVAAIAIGKYQEAGVIAFFVLIGNLIETRTALGARASIESLIRLTPTRASRVNPDGRKEEIDVAGLSTLYVVRNGRCIGWVGLEDRTRPEARAAIDELRELGVRVLAMVTGDRWSVARRVGREMGCTDVQAEVLPNQKLALVDQLKGMGHRVAVVGDGVNDAPALAAGHLGIAMGAAGSDVAINSASIALMNNDLSRLPFLIRLSQATTRVIRQNLLFGIAYITTLEVLAALGYLPAMLAAILHTSASAIVIFNSARLVRFGEHLQTRTVTPSPRCRQRSLNSARPRVSVPSSVLHRHPALPQEAVR